MAATGSSLNRLAFCATARCLTGCAIGEVLGLVIVGKAPLIRSAITLQEAP